MEGVESVFMSWIVISPKRIHSQDQMVKLVQPIAVSMLCLFQVGIPTLEIAHQAP